MAVVAGVATEERRRDRVAARLKEGERGRGRWRAGGSAGGGGGLVVMGIERKRLVAGAMGGEGDAEVFRVRCILYEGG
jgi:hypothetical protein